MAMLVADGVRAEVLGNFCVEQLGLGRVPCAGYTTRGRDVDGCATRDFFRRRQWCKSEEDRRRIASWVRDEAGPGDFCSGQLGQTIWYARGSGARPQILR